MKSIHLNLLSRTPFHLLGRIAFLLLALAPTPLFAQTIFKIKTLTPNNVTAVDATPQIGDDRGGIAVSTSKAFLVGDYDNANCCTAVGVAGVFNRTNLSGGSILEENRDGIVMDIHSQSVYTFADNTGTPVPANGLSAGTIIISELIQLDPATGALTGTVINLSSPITITFGSCCAEATEAGVFSGYDRIVIVDSTNSTGTAYNIDLPSGTVTNIGTLTAGQYVNRSAAENWATHGVAEFFAGNIYVAYVDGSAFPHTKILRTNVSNNVTSVVADLGSGNVSDGHEFTVVPSLGRWYFHYEGGDANAIAGNGGAGGETLAFADATFTIEPCAAVPPNMIAWWRGDGNADDSIGGHNGSLMAGATFDSGEVRQAFSFNGTSAHIEVPDSPSLNPTSQITIDAWVKTSTNSRQALVSKFNQSFSSPSGSYDLAILNDSLLEFRLDNVGYLQVPAAVCDGQWHHIAGTYDGANILCYVDGVLAASTSGSGGNITTSTLPLYLGAELRDNVDSGFLNGELDEVEIFNRALTADEIVNIYAAGPLGKCECTKPPPNMISWWPGEGDTTDIQDGNNLSDGSGDGFGFGAGEVGQAFTFNGGQVLTAGTPSNLAITGSQVTIDGWIYPTADGEALYFGKAENGGNDYALYNLFGSNQLVGVINENFFDTGFVAPLNTWTHIALTYDGSTMKVYANGSLVGSTSLAGNINNSGSPFTIGGRGSDKFFTGSIDEVEVFDRALTASEIAAIYHAGSAGKCRSCTPAPSAMVGWWPGDGDLTDIQGDHNGTGSGGGPKFSGGVVGPAMDFDGVDDFFTAANVPDPNKAFTFDAWVYWRGSTGSGQQNLVEKLDGIGGASYLLAIADSGLVVSVIGGNVPGGLTFNINDPIPVNQWTHIAETDDGSTVNIYINGQLATSVTADRNTSTDLLYFGSIGSQFFLNGEMDEIEIYSRDLSQSEIQAIYDAGSGGKCKPAVPTDRQLANISSRADVGTGDNVAIAGFIIQTDASTSHVRGPGATKQVLIRGIGPSITGVGSPILADPVLDLFNSSGVKIDHNDNWMEEPDGVNNPTRTSAIQATGLAPSDPNEAALLETLSSNNAYTAILSGKNGGTGIGLVEVYDLEATTNTHLHNLSTRAFVSPGDNVLIDGLIVQGDGTTRILVRGLGPSLAGQGISNPLPDPVLQLFDGNGNLIETNDDWGSSPEASDITTSGLAPTDSKESAILFAPAPGPYTAIIHDKNNGNGIGLVEAYWLGP